MKVIQTFWSGPNKNVSPFKINAGWLSPEYNWMSWALSCLLLRRQYERVELFTDQIGKNILIDKLQLPYTDVHIVFDDNFRTHPSLFSLAKIYTYSLQEEPFVHIDGDVYLWNRLPDSLLNSDLISSNIEVDLFFNKRILKEMNESSFKLPKHLKNVHTYDTIFSSNAGIIGGSNMSFIKRYCSEAFDFIKSNSDKLDTVNTSGFNWVIEQISLYYLSEQEHVPISYLMQEPVDHPIYKEYWRFADVPEVEIVHPVGGCKRELYVLGHLAKRLRFEFPEYYYGILRLFNEQNITLRDKLYSYVDLNKIGLNLHNPTEFSKALSSKIYELKDIDFFNSFGRTLNAIQYYYSKTLNSANQLSEFIQDRKIPKQIEEIYRIEKRGLELFQKSIREINKGKLYHQDVNQYRMAANFNFDRNWLEKIVCLADNVEIIETGWNWVVLKEKSITEPYKTIFDSEKSLYYLSLSFDVFSLGIEEIYHEGVDALTIKHSFEGKSIWLLLEEVKEFFQDNITVENMRYQKLIFDTIKRLTFKNVLYIK